MDTRCPRCLLWTRIRATPLYVTLAYILASCLDPEQMHWSSSHETCCSLVQTYYFVVETKRSQFQPFQKKQGDFRFAIAALTVGALHDGITHDYVALAIAMLIVADVSQKHYSCPFADLLFISIILVSLLCCVCILLSVVVHEKWMWLRSNCRRASFFACMHSKL